LNGKEIEKEGFSIILASVAQVDGKLETLGSRALAVVGLGEDVFNLSERMENLLAHIEPPSLRHRKDIGDKDIIRAKINKMRELRRAAA
jgi:phosphoribosylamine-glycine ligase